MKMATNLATRLFGCIAAAAFSVALTWSDRASAQTSFDNPVRANDGLRVQGGTRTDTLAVDETITADTVETRALTTDDISTSTLVADEVNVAADLRVGGRLMLDGPVQLPRSLQLNELNVAGFTRLEELEVSGPVEVRVGGQRLRIDDQGIEAASAGGGRIAVNDEAVSVMHRGDGLVASNGAVAVHAAEAVTVTGGGNTFSIDSSGARLSSASGGPVRLSGIADGVDHYDAVNLGQFQRGLRDVSRGVAMSMAMSQVPPPAHGKRHSFGFGLGHFDGQTALAAGATVSIADGLTARASLSRSGSRGGVGVGTGVGWSF